MSTRYVVGFLLNSNGQVALIRKNRPEWQKGKLNGVGGHIQDGEFPSSAMRREFDEEAGVLIDNWEPIIMLEYPGVADVFFFKAYGDYTIETKTDEPVDWYACDNLPDEVIPNLKWLIPFAVYGDEELNYRIIPYGHM